jgi:uncharacterized protein (DUF1697 family)
VQSWIALFRGINVGGNNILPMAELRQELESLGLCNVRTYIQSGNVVFESTAGKSSFLLKAQRSWIWNHFTRRTALADPSLLHK